MKLTCISTPDGTLGFRMGQQGTDDAPCEVSLSNNDHQIITVPFLREQVRELRDMLQVALEQTSNA